MTSPLYEVGFFDPRDPGENVGEFVAQVKALYDASFPIRYNDEFYDSFKTAVYLGRPLATVAARKRRRGGEQGAREVMGAVSVTTSNAFAEENFGERKMVYVLTIAVHEKYQRLGIASALIGEVLTWARGSGVDGTYLHVIAYNAPAIALYERLGLSQTRLERGFYTIEGKHYDAYLYVMYFPVSNDGTREEAESGEEEESSFTLGDAMDSLIGYFSSFTLISSYFGGVVTPTAGDDDDDDDDDAPRE